MILDVSKYNVSQEYYGGSERKIGLIINGEEYIIKFQKETNFGKKVNNHICEYLGSHIFSLLGFRVHQTYLGFYKGEQVVICKNFLSNNQQFVPFNDVRDSFLDEDVDIFQYEYEDIMELLRINPKLMNINSTIKIFWEMYVVDAIIGNFDRHGANWGFIKENNKYYLSPIFDNGSCLFPRLVANDEIDNVLNSREEIDYRIYKFPTSHIKLNGKKRSYYEVINSLKYVECNEAVISIYERLNINEIEQLIDKTPFVTERQKRFYKTIIVERFKNIVEVAYHKLKGGIK